MSIRAKTGISYSVVALGAALLMGGTASSAPHLSEAHLPVIAPPSAVLRAGGKELREFKTGARIAVETGCLACHELGKVGKTSPGPRLTHIGSLLSKRHLRAALLNPDEPMPAFRRLAHRKLDAIVRFLSLMR